MAISDTRIANMALSHLGTRDKIENLDEQSVEADEMALWYDYSRRTALEAHDWSFARKRLAAAVHGEDPPEGAWGFRYQYPADCVMMRLVWNPNGPDADAIPFEVEMADDGTKSVLTNMEDAIFIYTFEQANTLMYSAYFVKLFSYVLAMETAIALTGKRSIRDDMAKAVGAFILNASANDANERVGKPPRDTDWMRFRNVTGNTGINNDWFALPDAEN